MSGHGEEACKVSWRSDHRWRYNGQKGLFLLGVQARSAGKPIVIVRIRKTHRADQTVRARDLKPGQKVGLSLGTTYQSMTPIGP